MDIQANTGVPRENADVAGGASQGGLLGGLLLRLASVRLAYRQLDLAANRDRIDALFSEVGPPERVESRVTYRKEGSPLRVTLTEGAVDLLFEAQTPLGESFAHIAQALAGMYAIVRGAPDLFADQPPGNLLIWYACERAEGADTSMAVRNLTIPALRIPDFGKQVGAKVDFSWIGDETYWSVDLSVSEMGSANMRLGFWAGQVNVPAGSELVPLLERHEQLLKQKVIPAVASLSGSEAP